MAINDIELEEGPAAGVPPVVAVVVTCDPGPWLEETLSALAAQDYPNLSVLVVDAASEVDPTPTIAAALPSAYVRRLEVNAGFAAAANDVLGVVEGASHFVFLHDDAAPEPDAVRLLVEEAFRSNAGVVAPKLVAWDDPEQLLAVGASSDKAGVVRPYGRGELDQEQHDAVRDVFVAPGGCTLVRADLFETMGGFDAGIPLLGEDLDLSWRAQVLGARVVVAPAARVRHREATVTGERPLALGESSGDLAEQVARLHLRHRLRAVLKCYGPIHLAVLLPQLAVSMVAQAVFAVASGKRRLAGAVAEAWRWNLSGGGDLRAARRALQQRRALRDREIRRLQARGSSRLSGALQADARTFGVAAAGRELAGAVAAGGIRQTAIVWSSLAFILLVGSRNLLGGRLPAIGQLVPFPDGPVELLRLFLSGWRTSGLGATSPAPLAFGLLGTAGVLVGGAMGLLQKLVTLGMIPLGIVGMHRLTAPLGSWRARLAGAVLYASVTIPYDALAGGRWGGLVAYGASPWVLGRLLRATGLPPFGARPSESVAAVEPAAGQERVHPESMEELLGAEAGTLDPVATEEFKVAVTAVAGRHHDHDHDHEHDHDDHEAHEANGSVPAAAEEAPPVRRSLLQQAAAAAIVVALAAAFVPAIMLSTLVAALGLVVGGLVVGEVRATVRSLAVAVGAVAGAAILLVPWSLELILPGATWAAVAGAARPAADAPALADVVRFGGGPFGGSVFGWGLPLAAVLPLLVGSRWRFSWAGRLWLLAVVTWGLVWAAGRGWFGVPSPSPEVLLAPAAAALVLAAALGLSAFERDLRGYQFGWRQVASIAAAGAAAVATFPVIAGAVDGQWRMPRRDFQELLAWMPEREADGAFRVLWAGHPLALPLDGWRLSEGVAYGTSRGGTPDLATLWPASDHGPTGLLADALGVARRGETSRLGHLLAPMGVRYVVVPSRAAPVASGGGHRPEELATAPDLVASLRAQVDLRLIESGDDVVVYENAAWAPARAVLPPAASEASRRTGPDAARTAEMAGAAPALTERAATRFDGPWPGPELYFAEAYSSRWGFAVDGDDAAHRKAFGWANAFASPAGERSTLRYRTSPVRYAGLALEVLLWVAAVRIIRGRRAKPEVVAG